MVKENKLQKKNLLLLLGVVLLIFIGIFRNQIQSLFGLFWGVAVDKTINLTAPQKDSFNLALLGIGGGTHDGPDLTDTMILVNVNVKQNKVHMFSIPRDLWIPDQAEKINAVYAIAQGNNNGIQAAQQIFEKVTGQKIDYVIVLDFEGFTKLVDYLGGINVNVENTFQDNEYPITGKEEDTCGKSKEELDLLATASSQLDAFPCRYKTVSFVKGPTIMDGQTALEYVRSRHGNNGEGSDFARSRRQQLVIAALKDKVFSLGVILNPIKVIGVYNILKSNINTNIPTDNIDDFIKLANKLKNGEIKNYVIDYGDESAGRYGLLINPPMTAEYSYQWILIPRIGNGNFSELKEYVSCNIQNKDCIVGQKGILTPTPSLSPSPISKH